MTCRILVIGYGNELRRDDGVGPCVARAAAALSITGLQAMAVHQLTPELAERMADVEQVIFVDAGPADEAEGCCRPLEPANCLSSPGHVGDPCELLGLAELVYGRRPPAWLITVPVVDLDYGEGLSAIARRGLNVALHMISRIAAHASPVETADYRRSAMQ